MKTHEEIKKGLECCPLCSKSCAYYKGIDCYAELHYDALAYIQQLEAKVLELEKMCDAEQLKASQAIAETAETKRLCSRYGQMIMNTFPKWISVEERLPEPETQVLILAKRRNFTIITNGIHEDGTLNTEDSDWHWYDNDFEYDEENDAYIIPEGWWEYKHYNGDDEYNHAIDDKVTHWMPLPEPPKEG